LFTSPFGGYSYELANPDTTWQYNGDFKKVRGKHELSFGVRFTRYRHIAGAQGAASQSFQPATTGLPGVTQTGEALASFMAGYPESSGRFLFPIFNDWGEIYNGYFGDTWKVTSKFTLNLGLQYVYATPPVVEQGGVKDAISLFDWGKALTQPNATEFTYAYYWCSKNPITGAAPNCPRNSLMEPDRKNFAPRLGIAYALRKNTVIRTGFGMFFDFNSNIEQNSIRVSSANWPYSNSLNISGQNTDFLGPISPVLSLDNPWPTQTGAPPGSNQSINRFDRTPYAMEWNFGIEQLLPKGIKLSVDYVGSGGRRLVQARFQNMAVVGSGSIASRKPVHNASTFAWRATDGNSNYDALQMKLERSFQSGLTFMNSFTWSKSLDTVSDANAAIGPPGYTNNLSLSRGPSDFNVPFVNTTSFVYDLPIGRGKKYASSMGRVPDTIIGGWETSGIINIRSGIGYSVLAGSDVANLGIDAGQVAQILSAAVPSGFNQTRTAWFNTSAFQLPVAGTLGNSSRNFLIGPAYQDVDFALMKNFRIVERLKLQFRTETFNLFNHTNFGNPTNSLASANFGQILSANSSRQIQFGLKLLW
jgi:hypothetical protein